MNVGRRREGCFDRALSGGAVTTDGIVERQRKPRLGHLYAAFDERLKLHPAHRLALALPLQQTQALCLQEQARVVGVDAENVVLTLRMECEATRDNDEGQTIRTHQRRCSTGLPTCVIPKLACE